MTNETERLSLGEVEALARDALVRAGVRPQAAEATAWAIRASERNGDSGAGLERLPRLLEGLRMASISAAARPVLSRAPAARLSVDADGGLSDAAISIALETMVELVRSYGSALLTVTDTGDLPMSRPWAERLASHGVLAVVLGGDPSSGAAFPNSGEEAAFQAETLTDGFRESVLFSLTGAGRITPVKTAEPPLEPVGGQLCILGLAVARGSDVQGSALDEVHRASNAALAARRHQADTAGVDVSSEVLVRILTF